MPRGRGSKAGEGGGPGDTGDDGRSGRSRAGASLARQKPGLWLVGLLEDLAVFERTGERANQARVLARIARQAVSQGESARALRACRFGIEAAEDEPEIAGELWGVAARALAVRGHRPLSRACYDRAEALFLGAALIPRALAAATANAILLGHDDPAAGRARLRALLAQAVGAPEAGLSARILCALGEIDLRDGRPNAAELCGHAAEEALRHARLEPSAHVALLLARAHVAQGAPLDAEAAYERGLLLLGTAAAPSLRCRTREELARLQFARGDVERARATLGEALLAARQGGGAGIDPGTETRIALGLAASFLDENPAEALRHVTAAVDSLRRLTARPPRFDALMEEAERLLARMSPTDSTAQLSGWLGALSRRPR